MQTTKHLILNGNQAAARIAYKINEVCAIYPITPASEMSELVEEWSAKQQENIFGDIPSVIEMQSEAGVAGALHGALQTGSLATTFTASQGLLLMLPNMYKIAGELTPNVIHVATRSVASHALSVFGDHSDIMAARNTGYGFLGAASVQEAMDFALISQAASLASRIPFVHFFDGFRTSHEINKINDIPDEIIQKMLPQQLVEKHRERALNPDNPFVRGTSQGPDVFFQSREATNTFYSQCPEIVQEQMNNFYKLTGRAYQLFEYIGHPEAERIVVSMASSCATVEKAIEHLLKQGEKVGMLKVRLYRPFSASHLIAALPASCRCIAVLDRTKEPGATGEPLYLDVLHAVNSETGHFKTHPIVLGGRYGLSSKEFTPGMVKAVFDSLKAKRPKNGFTLGIKDDITHTSLDYTEFPVENNAYQAVFYQTKSEDAETSFKNMISHLGQRHYVQGYTECDYKKTASRAVAHLRVDKSAIDRPYLISEADFVGCDSINFIETDNVLSRLKVGGTLLVNSSLRSNELWKHLSSKKRSQILKKKISLYSVNLNVLSPKYELGTKWVSPLQACFLSIKNKAVSEEDFLELHHYISKVDTTFNSKSDCVTAHQFERTFLGQLLAGNGNELEVGAFPVDGTYSSGTSAYESSAYGDFLPEWDYESCTQCGLCSIACPQAALRLKAYDPQDLEKAPTTFRSVKALEPDWVGDLLNFTLQINPDQCNSCGNCLEACPAKALKQTVKKDDSTAELENWKFFEKIPEFDRLKIDPAKISQQQLQEPLFKYPQGVLGCGQAPYLKLISQLFGDRMLVANATGASSIFGGALPTTPWSKDKNGRGPAWSNSLFEDNAEFGLGFRLSQDQQNARAKRLLSKLKDKLPTTLVNELLNASQKTEQDISQQRAKVVQLKNALREQNCSESKSLLKVADSLVTKSVWIVGGDGWAYDIGYGGLDHVLASGANVNILVLDNEVYSNTGGQMSKSTPFGATAKFAHSGRKKAKKDLGMLAMNYDNTYVASVSIGADPEHTLQTLLEAESYEGPSLVIAYCHSPAHGIDVQNPSQYQKAAVASGQWLLYRRDPRWIEMGMPSFQLDSEEPTLPIEDYLRLEKRFSKTLADSRTTESNQICLMQKSVDQRYKKYLGLTRSEFPERERSNTSRPIDTKTKNILTPQL